MSETVCRERETIVSKYISPYLEELVAVCDLKDVSIFCILYDSEKESILFMQNQAENIPPGVKSLFDCIVPGIEGKLGEISK